MKYNQVIIIPAYKPKEDLIGFVQQLRETFENIVVVDDGGQDEFRHIFDQVGELGATVLVHEVNQGKGRALKTAFKYCSEHEDISKSGVITVDADGQHKIPDICKVADAMEANPEKIVMGCRMFNTGNVPARSLLGNTISRYVYKWFAGINVSDTQTGLRGLPYSFLAIACETAGDRYEYETNMLIDIKRNGYEMTEVGIETVYENDNETSHFNPLVDSVKIYAVILKYSISSLASAGIDYLVFAIGLHFGLSILIATYVARAISCIFNFTINKKVVFKGQGNTIAQFAKYIILVIISGTLSGWGVTQLSHLLPQVYPVIIKVPVECILYVFNFIVQRKLIFKNKTNN